MSRLSFERLANSAYRRMYYGPLRCARAFRVQRWLESPPEKEPKIFFSEKGHLLFYSIPKNGTTTIRQLFLDLDNLEILEWLYHEDLKEKAHQYGDYFRFTFVRNPWDRLVSCYLDKVLRERPGRFYEFAEQYSLIRFGRMSFADFVHFVCRVPRDLCDRHFRPQADFFTPGEVDFVGRFERYSDGLRHVIERNDLDRKFLSWCDAKTNQSLNLIGGGGGALHRLLRRQAPASRRREVQGRY